MKVVLGGSFDPVHIGHLRLATELAERLGCMVDLMPCNQAVHKAPQAATAAQRRDMLRLAVDDNALLNVDERELNRDSASYTITSLDQIRSEIGAVEPLIFVMGSDSADHFDTWQRAKDFASYAHVIVLRRPDSASSADWLPRFNSLGFRQAECLSSLNKEPSGLVVELSLSELDISSTTIRECVQQKHSIRYIVTDAVRQYICDNELYT